ncbi:Type-2Aa cytolytic delta-endotoxin [Streptomyces sp. NPDC001970]
MTYFTVISAVSPSRRSLIPDVEDAFQGAADIQEAARGLPGSSLVRIVPGFGLQETTSVGVLVRSLKESVRQALARPFTSPAFWKRAERALAGAFTGLNGQMGAPHLTFRDEGAESTRYTYNLLFVLEDEETGDRAYVTAFCLDVTLALGRERAGALALEDTASYAIRLDAITVRVPVRQELSDLSDAQRGLAGQQA